MFYFVQLLLNILDFWSYSKFFPHTLGLKLTAPHQQTQRVQYLHEELAVI